MQSVTPETHARQRVPPPPPDPALPTLGRLVDPDFVASRLAAHLAPGATLTDLRIARVAYRPGTRCQVTYGAVVDGERRVVVTTASRGYRGAAGGLADPAPGPVARLSGDDPELGALVFWLPADPWLPHLATLTADLPAILASAGVAAADGAWTLLGYRPGERAVAAAGPAVVKLYGSALDADRAAAAFGWAAGAIGASAPRLLDVDRGRRLTVQQRVDGVQLDHLACLDAAPAAGVLLGRLHASSTRRRSRQTAAGLLARAAVAADLAAVLRPELAPRTLRVMSRLGATLPANGSPVASHGDFNVSQIVCTAAGNATLLDFDEHCLAAPALDVAAFAANAVSGRPGDGERAPAARDALLATYGAPPADLPWYTAAAILCRAPSPFRLQKRRWPERLEAIITAAEEALPA